MPDILDKFGKSSIDTDYAIATTVKTTRVSGVAVLEAFDLSRFADDTPVFFVTYKKTTDPLTDVVSVTNLVSWKALVNAGANTLTNLTLAPGYTDDGNDVGDFIECIPTSYWENSLIDALLTSFNPDGTLKTAAVQEALNISGAIPPDYTPLANPPSSVTYLGQRSYEMVFNGVDYTDRLNPSTRLRTTRTAAAPVQCTSLNGTTQYWVKTSPNKLTFTDDFVVSVWVKLASYPASSGVIVSRYNGTSGWGLVIGSEGTVDMYGRNGASANVSRVTSYQSIPLNKWVHIAVQLDMSAFTATTTTSYIMIDGTDVPAYVTRGGTNPTSLLQAGNLEIGSQNGGTVLFPGKIAQVAIFNAKVTQAIIRTYISQGLSGSEASIASAYSFSNAVTDLNIATPNDLSIGGGAATATNADSPFGTQGSGLISPTLDYGIVTAATFSTNTTVTVQAPAGNTIPTSGGVSEVLYSGMAAPYGMPKLTSFRLSAFNATDTKALAAQISDFIISQATDPIRWAQNGNAGGGFYFTIDSGRVAGYGFTATLALSAAANTPYVINFPSGMFTDIHQFGLALGAGQATTNQYVGISGNAALTTTQAAFYLISTAATVITATQTKVGYTFNGI
jgi:hypothetical protein